MGLHRRGQDGDGAGPGDDPRRRGRALVRSRPTIRCQHRRGARRDGREEARLEPGGRRRERRAGAGRQAAGDARRAGRAGTGGACRSPGHLDRGGRADGDPGRRPRAGASARPRDAKHARARRRGCRRVHPGATATAEDEAARATLLRRRGPGVPRARRACSTP